MLFKILHGDASRISTEITPFHEGYCYVTHDGCMYIDMNIGTKENPNNQRVKLNAGQTEPLLGYDITTVLNSSDTELPTSRAVLSAIDALRLDMTNMAAVVLAEAQADASNKAAVVLAEAQKSITSEIKSYVDDAILNGAW